VGNHASSTPYYPAAYPEVIAVAATGVNDKHYSPSGTGEYLDVVAPGITIWSTGSEGPDFYEFRSGTSMATAHVTGLVALMLSLNPDLYVEDIRSLLRDNAVDLGDPGVDTTYGWGRIDAAATLQAVPYDDEPPYIVHDGGASTRPFSGYIDPRAESTDGANQDLGVRTVVINFNEPVRNVGSQVDEITGAAFTVRSTGSASPQVVSVDASQNPRVTLQLSGPLPAGEWTTVVADVEDLSGNPIESDGDLGPFDNEADRVDIGFLPGDVDQNAIVSPFDLLQYRQIITGHVEPPIGFEADYTDIDRDGDVDPYDLLHYRQLIQGDEFATRAWAGETLPERP
jgi:hypothetical protein